MATRLLGWGLAVVPGLVLALVTLRWHLAAGRDEAWSVIGAFAGSALLVGAAWLASLWLRSRRDCAAIDHLLGGHRGGDGDWVACCGIAEAVAETLTSPLSRQPALACRYRVSEVREHHEYRHEAGRKSRNKSKIRRFVGFHRVPTRIRGEHGAMQLAGFPDVTWLDRSMAARGLGDAAAAALAPAPGWLARQRLLSEAIGAGGQRVAIDWRFGQLDPQATTENLEWLLAPGDEVCVLGRRQGDSLHPGRSHPDGLPIYAGSPEVARSAAADRSRGSGLLALFLAATGLAVLLALPLL